MNVQGRHKIKSFNLNNPDDRAECEEVLSKYSQLMGRIVKYETCFTKEGAYFAAIHWIEDVKESEYRD
jgi:hypothetical protein